VSDASAQSSPGPSASEPTLATWADALHETIASRAVRSVDRAVVLDETASTQDAALRLAGGRPGLLVVAGRQTAGRGRLGRSWNEGLGLGIAATFVLDASRLPPQAVSLAAGIGALEACQRCLPPAPGGVLYTLGLRWPNDVVTREASPAGPGKKLAGVLIETRDGLHLVGIGINVLHAPDGSDFPPELAPRATSLRALGSAASRLDALTHLVVMLDRALLMPAIALPIAWAPHDVLRGSVRTFEHDGVRVTGRVEAIDPAGSIVLRTDAGEGVRLPALSTSLAHDA
jgi:BirA family biotin operon repressor/biotin-[acetyl-CoA-carboxylase] ligase